ncbi:Dipeptidyl aminopeptidase/acylaminoacyl-peptidase-like protein [Chthoniobacter flavus Ellin428]|uniref:Dipeptidyl aminopeptidase/acylaminoacyl-peptidase-like protein n=1 Tax=Chthoniobacter flavus Ellin428 TaxID=497964 RepID=B4DBU1_9BACT|nr:prolyl oligopeptidase family serine peptidase [Chthoniobacter flavus]EDY16120.1 Dipeptidyl aminopeptidase/acylaminoacyl-peptidase-like protein [Chthoniobacter flavus Ellin428]TCO83974.1 prolyl oligopeptidase family protein [Chthoniobacter flavus]
MFLLRVFSVAWAVAVCPISALLLLTAVTGRGRMFAIGALLLGAAPALAWLRRSGSQGRWRTTAGLAAFVLWGLITFGLVVVSPNGAPRKDARVQNRYSDGGWHYPRFALGALLPEIDQLLLGFRLVPMADSLFSMKQSREISGLTRSIYAELEADDDFRALGSVLPETYDEIWGRRFNHGHYFLYIPPRLDRKIPAPVLVFLHGSGGNFEAYTWLLSKVADERGMVLIAPTFGMGNWDAQHSGPVVMAALEDAARVIPLDLSQVHLAGLSNGGLGVSYVAASEAGRRFRSFIFLSPVCDDDALSSKEFTIQARDKPVLIVTGESDDRVPLPSVVSCAALMKSAGARVEMSAYPGADHFLVFSHRERFLKQLSDWLGRQSVPHASP